MTNEKTPEELRKEGPATEAERKSIDGKAGQPSGTSHNEKSNTKAGRDTGAGGGAKQQRHH